MTAAIVRKELTVLWTSPVPYVLGAAMQAALGLLGHGQITGRGQAVFQPVVPIAGFLLVLAAPVLAARTVAEEIRTGTLELLLAARVPPLRIAAGKYVALTVSLLALLAPVGLFAVILAAYGSPDPGPVATGLAGLVLMTAALCGVGLAVSSLTSSQPVAAAGALFVVLVLWFAHVGSQALEAGGLLASFSISERLRAFAGGAIGAYDVAFFMSVAALGVAAAAAGIASRAAR